MCFFSLVVVGFLLWLVFILFGIIWVLIGVRGLDGVCCLMDEIYKDMVYMLIYYFFMFFYFVIVFIWFIVVYVCIVKRVLKFGKFKDWVSFVVLNLNVSMWGFNGSCIFKLVIKMFMFLVVIFVYIVCVIFYYVLVLFFFLICDLDCKLFFLEV